MFSFQTAITIVESVVRGLHVFREAERSGHCSLKEAMLA